MKAAEWHGFQMRDIRNSEQMKQMKHGGKENSKIKIKMTIEMACRILTAR
jgi:hypothetical protein